MKSYAKSFGSMRRSDSTTSRMTSGYLNGCLSYDSKSYGSKSYGSMILMKRNCGLSFGMRNLNGYYFCLTRMSDYYFYLMRMNGKNFYLMMSYGMKNYDSMMKKSDCYFDLMNYGLSFLMNYYEMSSY
jgi:hypothetical protein